MELIKITKSQGGKDVVSLRNLYDFLQSKENFKDWANRMFTYGFEENVDYQASNVFIEAKNGFGGTTKMDFAITMNCAKEISMLQRSKRGKEARLYFIDREQQAKDLEGKQIPKNYLSALKALVTSEEQKQLALIEVEKHKKISLEAVEIAEDLENDLKEVKPKVEYCDKVLSSKDTYLITEIADELNMSAIKLNKLLKSKRIQYKAGNRWVLYQKYRNLGYTDTKTAEFSTSEGEVRTNTNMVWTEKGRNFVHSKIK